MPEVMVGVVHLVNLQLANACPVDFSNCPSVRQADPSEDSISLVSTGMSESELSATESMASCALDEAVASAGGDAAEEPPACAEPEQDSDDDFVEANDG